MPDELEEPHVMGGTVQLRVQQRTRLRPAIGGGEIDDRKLLVREEDVFVVMVCVREMYGCPGGRQGWGGVHGCRAKRDEGAEGQTEPGHPMLVTRT